MTYILKNKTKNRHFDVLKDVVESFLLTYDEFIITEYHIHPPAVINNNDSISVATDNIIVWH